MMKMWTSTTQQRHSLALLVVLVTLAMPSLAQVVETPLTTPETVLLSELTTSASPPAASPSFKSAEINIPGLGEVNIPDFSSFKLPNLTIPTLPNLPELPKIFPQAPCVSLVSGRLGSCIRQVDDCIATSGLPDGSCAAGFGVCCTRPFTCGQTVIGNVSVISSPGYPEPTTSSSLCTITLMKQLNVQQIRLDLEVFDVAGVDESGNCAEDVMEIIGANSGVVIPRICGLNSGQHLYIPVDKTLPLTPVLIKFIFSQSAKTSRLFRIKVTQLAKGHPDLAPANCLQYVSGQTGVVRSFNYEPKKNVGIRSIRGLNYGICFRKEAGFCSVKVEPTFTRVSRSIPQNHYYYQMAAPHRYAMAPHYYAPAARYHYSYAMPHHKAQYTPEVYYKPKEEKKVEVKEELDGLLAKKKLLIEELFSGLQVPALPSLVIPTLPPVVTPVLPKLKTLDEMLEENKELLDNLLKSLKTPVIPTLAPVVLPDLTKVLEAKKEVLIESKPVVESAYGEKKEEKLIEKKVELVNELLGKKKEILVSKPVYGHHEQYKSYGPAAPVYPHPHHQANYYYKPEEKKVELKEKVDSLLEEKKKLLTALGLSTDLIETKAELVNQLFDKKEILVSKPVYGHHEQYKSYGPGVPVAAYPHPHHQSNYYYKPEVVEKKVELKDKVDSLLEEKKKLLTSLGLSTDLIEKKVELVKGLVDEKKEVVYPHPPPAVPYYHHQQYPQQQLYHQSKLHAASYQHPQQPQQPNYHHYKPTIVEKKVEVKKEIDSILEEKKKLLIELLSGKMPSLVSPAVVKSPAVVEETVVSSGNVCQDRDRIVVSNSGGILCVDNSKETVLTSEPFVVFVDSRGKDLSRGFSFTYRQEVC